MLSIFQKKLLPFCILLLPFCVQAQQTFIQYLSGTDKDHTVPWKFFCSSGMNSNRWTTIPVPSNWELQGFGAYNYGQDKNKHDEQGLYQFHFNAAKSWANKQIEIVFEGVMTDADVKINGVSAGPVHQGAFYRFQYNISKLIKPGADNLLEVVVSKMSADSTVNKAEREGDFWVFGGIFRPVYLKILPQNFIERVAIDARDDGNFNMDVFTENSNEGDELSAEIKTLKGEKLGSMFSTIVHSASGKTTLSRRFSNPLLWNPEYPNLYLVDITLRRNQIVLHQFSQRFGFRTVEVRKSDGIYVNGKKIIFKGVNRHSSWPTSGKTLSREIQLMDIDLIKGMNMNAVRMSHYPPDAEFLDLCDSMGLFVLDELTGWHQKYATPVGEKLVKELVTRDVNHPSIVFWDNGNEGGWNTDLDDDYDLYDPQHRTVLHPWSKFNHIDTKHYPDYAYVETAAAKEDILLHTEMIHGLYDGGHGAGLDDYWNLIRKNPRHAGGFLWVLADEGVLRRDKNDSMDTDGNHAPDGIVSPYREKEGSYYTIKEIWSPVQIIKPVFDEHFTGKLEISNEYFFTNLSACSFSWKLLKFPLATDHATGSKITASGKASLSLAPGENGIIDLHLPANWHAADALLFTARDRYGNDLNTWTWRISFPSNIAFKNISGSKTSKIILEENKVNTYAITVDSIRYEFDTTSGYLKSVYKNNIRIPFGDGPGLAGIEQKIQSFQHQPLKDGIFVQSIYAGDDSLRANWLFEPGMPAVLVYSYKQNVPADFYGITFQTDEAMITGMKWLGDGPFRVWKNRLKGTTLNVWEKKYNNTVTGETYGYPEFKGYHSNLYWVNIQTTASSFTVYTDTEGLYLQMLRPAKPSTVFIPYVNPNFPSANLGFLNAIAPIGTKFKAANTMGPQSQINQPSKKIVTGRLIFDFR